MSGVEYIKGDLSQHPQCVHGPTFLLGHETPKGYRRFFTCSACRNRKDCGFRVLPEHKRDKAMTENAQQLVKERKRVYSDINHYELYSILEQIRATPEKDRSYCFTCNKFIINHHDTTHDTITGVTDEQIKYPTKFLKPLENDKVEAQYLFDDETIKITIKILRDHNLNNVLCIGTPTIYQYIKNECNDMTALLLDFDRRYHNFYGPEEFSWYNLFNNYFFISDSKNVLKNFVKNGENIVLLMDPPFGGRLEPISETINTIEEELKILNPAIKILPMLFYMPYFMEPHIKNHLPTLKMADYKVNYDNNESYSNQPKSRKYGSAARIFTNLSLDKVKFDVEGYRYCDICERYVYNENQHCDLCNACTSKDGRTYIHCNECNRCVKPNWIHCKECKRCTLLNHKCQQEEFKQECFHCHERGHKKAQCPKMNVCNIKRKRKEKNKNNKKNKKQM